MGGNSSKTTSEVENIVATVTRVGEGFGLKAIEK